MSAQVKVEGVMYEVEAQTDGRLRISHPQPQTNAMFGLGTDFQHCFMVHPCQRHQFDFWNAQLPAAERVMPEPRKDENRPWWSFGSGHGGGSRD